jgi:error-prone DNA polymerase
MPMQLRRSMAAWKRKGGVDKFEARLIGGMLANGYSEEFAHRIFEQILGFGDYGFPESHAYSFALLAWSSSWLKCHEPACFLAAMLNSQPMGFYGPSQLIQDAQRHGIQVLQPDVSHSDWDCTLETPADGLRVEPAMTSSPAVRLGLRLVGSLKEEAARRIPIARQQGAFADTEDLALRAQLDVQDLAPWPRPMPCSRWPAIAASRSGKPPAGAARPSCCSTPPSRKSRSRCRPRRKARRSCSTTPRWG